MCERTCPGCGCAEHYEMYGLIGTHIGCNNCGLILANRRDIEAAPTDLTEGQAEEWQCKGTFVLPGAEAKDPADDAMFRIEPEGKRRAGGAQGMTRATIMTQQEIDIDMKTAAEWFAALSDDDQAQFFIEVARLASEWPNGGATFQWTYIGGHLANCKCSTPEARDMVRGIAAALETSTHGA